MKIGFPYIKRFAYTSRRIIMENKELETNVEIENKEADAAVEEVKETAAEEIVEAPAEDVAAEEAPVEEVAAEEATEEATEEAPVEEAPLEEAKEEVVEEAPVEEEKPAEEEPAEEVEESKTLVVAPEATITEEELKEASFFTTFMEKAKKVNWKKVWDKVSTGLLILIMAAPVLILAYIFYWFLTK